MSTYTQIMRPGILVALRTRVSGGVHYARTDLPVDPSEADDAVGSIARWETIRTMEDPEEYKRAREVGALASAAISRLCIRTSFGLLCPTSREEELDLAIAAARWNVDLWNTQTMHTTVTVNAIKGRIADNDEEAVRSLIAEATELVERMDQGLARADVQVIRDAASRARKLIGIMDNQAADSISAAVDAARQAAREIVRRVDTEGKRAEDIVGTVNREAFDGARFAFLDIAKTELDSLPAVDVQRMAEIEAYRQTNLVRSADTSTEDTTETEEA